MTVWMNRTRWELDGEWGSLGGGGGGQLGATKRAAAGAIRRAMSRYDTNWPALRRAAEVVSRLAAWKRNGDGCKVVMVWVVVVVVVVVVCG